MRVNPADGRCRECGSALTIIDVDDTTMTVECDRGHCYLVETDAFGDGGVGYYVDFLTDNLDR